MHTRFWGFRIKNVICQYFILLTICWNNNCRYIRLKYMAKINFISFVFLIRLLENFKLNVSHIFLVDRLKLVFCSLPFLWESPMLVSIAAFSVCCIPVYFSILCLVEDIWICSIFPPSCTQCCSSRQVFSRVLLGCLGLQLFILLDT